MHRLLFHQNLVKFSLIADSSPKLATRTFSWTQFGSNANGENEEDEIQLYSERRLLGYSKNQVQFRLIRKYFHILGYFKSFNSPDIWCDSVNLKMEARFFWGKRVDPPFQLRGPERPLGIGCNGIVLYTFTTFSQSKVLTY